MQSESKDGKLEIVKQIKKVNNDGSYTIGYEADDGSFKIESRDVLGNIKGTYGFVDDDGEIKRVSYSTSNTTEVVTTPKPDPASVVQRIPRLNRTQTTTTSRRPYSIHSTTATRTTPASTTVVQSIPKRRTTQSTTSRAVVASSTTERPSYTEVIKAAVEATKSPTIRPTSVVFVPSIPVRAHVVQERPTYTTHAVSQKSEGQILRPEVATTDIPLARRFVLRNPLFDNESSLSKPVTEEPEVHGNLLRRQLQPDKSFDAEQHVINLRQSHGSDAIDVYSASMHTGTPRPLFTTTVRPRVLQSTVPPYPLHYQRGFSSETTTTAPELVQEATTTEGLGAKYGSANPTPVPQAARQEPFVAVRHPYRGVILIPVSHLQGRDVQTEREPPPYNQQPQYVLASELNQPQPQPPANDPNSIPVYLRRIPAPIPTHLRSMPVRVDENGFVREMPQRNIPTTVYPVQVPVTLSQVQSQRYVDNDIDNDIDRIKPPVSVQDFQKLLEQLVARQTRLEQVSALTRRLPEFYQTRPVYQPTPVPYVIARNPEQQTGPVQFLHHQNQRQRQYIDSPESQASQYQQIAIRVHPDLQNRQQYVPIGYTQPHSGSRRVARLLDNNNPPPEQDTNEDYLPPDVREMLLLRMLQLAINPTLPLDAPDIEALESAPTAETRKQPVRNVEILGEEEDEKRSRRSKRYETGVSRN